MTSFKQARSTGWKSRSCGGLAYIYILYTRLHEYIVHMHGIIKICMLIAMQASWHFSTKHNFWIATWTAWITGDDGAPAATGGKDGKVAIFACELGHLTFCMYGLHAFILLMEEIPNNHSGMVIKHCKYIMGYFLPTSTGEFTGFLNHQQGCVCFCSHPYPISRLSTWRVGHHFILRSMLVEEKWLSDYCRRSGMCLRDAKWCSLWRK